MIIKLAKIINNPKIDNKDKFKIIKSDVECSNGVIHAIDNVLLLK